MDLWPSFTFPLILLTACLLFLLWRGPQAGRRSLPPGPRSLPLLGNLLQLWGPSLLGSLLGLRDKYGPVFTIYLGSQWAVVLWGYEAVKEAWVDQAEEFSGREGLALVDRTSKGNGLFFSNGETWRQLSRFALSTLRNFGVGKRSIEERIQEEVQYLLEEIRKTEANPCQPTFMLRRSISNVICSVVFRAQFSYEDEAFQMLLGLIQVNFWHVDTVWVQLYNLFPAVMNHLPGPHNRLFENFEEQKCYVAGVVWKHKETLDPASPWDYTDTFLIRMQQEENDPDTKFHQENLILSALDLFFTGTETTSTTLRYGLLILLKYPHITERIQEEIERVIGQDHVPCMEDRSKMPYTDAVIHEIQRFADIIPLGVPHSVTRDTRFRGYSIPKGTVVFPILHSVLHDPTQFKDPETFDLGHFLDEEGGFRKNAAFMAFSAGKRTCPSEGLAHMELFFFTSILQRFALCSPARPQDLDITPEYHGFGKVPRRHQLRLVPR
ncbi:cytochrome P450 2B4-like [Gopherus evgoodei]|uniref:cytochrome P450 2B4-like n=1 Tax=Gopherus evgoodei TaxID=1825980 RepID=UPI0011CFE0F7|nr:cytochrome P450 2B4-like [Gopherus evgoodei]XP_030402523.1 cytochrome P450 2B4-like [Gopherus evgoodei]